MSDYVRNLKSQIFDACKRAAQNSQQESERHIRDKNKHTEHRTFKKGDKVLILLPKNGNNLFMRYQGPYEVITSQCNNNYLCCVKGRNKLYHANLLKKYFARTPEAPHGNVTPTANCAYIHEEYPEKEAPVEFFQVTRKEFPAHASINQDLTADRYQDVKELLECFDATFTDIPGKTNVVEHEIRLVDNTPFRIRQYPIPFHATDAVDKEIDNMIAAGIVRSSTSPYCSPITVVTKRDQSVRLCLDFRKLNSLTVFDAEPLPTLEELVTKLEGAKFFTKFDLTKGYWQIPLKEECKHYTAFQSNRGLLEFNFMPFGLSTASCSFNRAIRIATKGLKNVVTYFDDVLIFSDTWEKHMLHVHTTLEALEKAGLTVRPSKTSIGYTTIDFLGHTITEGQIKPDTEKTQKIHDLQIPTTKKEVRRVVGLLNYYRRFINSFSELSSPLTELTKKGSPNKIVWSEQCQHTFGELKRLLTSRPVLALPNLNKVFFVQTDASNKAIGAVLMQEIDGCLHPCQYASRKLLEREANYAIIEKECLAIVFALHTFSKYLIMKPFYILSDHKPLSFLKTNKSRNSRLTRWALSIQTFAFTIQHIRGVDNVLSDALSRAY